MIDNDQLSSPEVSVFPLAQEVAGTSPLNSNILHKLAAAEPDFGLSLWLHSHWPSLHPDAQVPKSVSPLSLSPVPNACRVCTPPGSAATTQGPSLNTHSGHPAYLVNVNSDDDVPLLKTIIRFPLSFR